MSHAKPHAARVPALDGLRGVAIALVLKEHLYARGGGWAGVDLFFALSGYLITTILLAERDETHFWKIFYVRRVTRIVPAFLLLLVLCTAVMQVDWPLLWPYVVSSLTNVAMIRLPSEVSVAGLGILWSLCVEEHFYLVWPTLVRRFSVGVLAAIAVGIVVLEPLARLVAVLHGAGIGEIYFLTPFRLDAIALGSLLAIASDYPVAQKWLFRIAPVVLVVCGAVQLSPFMPGDFANHPRVFVLVTPSVVALFGAAFVAYVLQRKDGVVARALSIAPLTFLGRISYGLYLYHQTLSVFVGRMAARLHFTHGRTVHLVSLVVSIAVAWLSFRFVETPALEYGRRKARSLRSEEDAVRAQVSANADRI